MLEAVEEIDSRIREHEDAIRLLRSRRNTLIYVSRLPTEILCDIFTLASWDNVSLHGRHITHVCALWRAVALACPSIWSNLKIDYYCRRPEWDMEMLRRSMEAPITIRVWRRYSKRYSSLPPSTSLLDEVLKCLPRITELWLAVPTEALEKLFLSTQPATILRELYLDGGYRDNVNVVVPDDLFLGTTPALKHVHLKGCYLNWTAPWLKNLTALSLTSLVGLGNLLSLEQMLSAFGNMTSLQSLVLDRVFNHASPSWTAMDRSHPVHLRSLTSLHLYDIGIADLCILLHHLCLPPSIPDVRIFAEWTDSTSLDKLTSVLNALDDCGDQRLLAQPFVRLFLAVKPEELSFSIKLSNVETFESSVDDDVDPSIKLRIFWTEDENPPDTFWTVIENNLIKFVKSTIPLSNLHALFLELRNTDETHKSQQQLLALCPKVQHLTLCGANPHFLVEQLGALAAKPAGAMEETFKFLPQLRTLVIRDADFESGTEMDGLAATLNQRRVHNASLNKLKITEAHNFNAADSEMLRKLVDDMDWDQLVLPSVEDYLEEVDEEEDGW